MSKAKITDEQISFQAWLRHDEAAEAYFRTKARGQSSKPSAIGSDSNLVRVKNSSGAARRLGELLEFSNLLFSNLDDGLLWFDGGAPALTNGFGVLVWPCPESGIETCQVSGACKALVNVTDTSHKYAFVKKSTYVLQSGYGGEIEILYKPSGTGEKTCAVLLGGQPLWHRGICDTASSAGDTKTVRRYEPGTTTDSGIEDQVTNELGSIPASRVWYYSGSGASLYVFAAKVC